jgi:hypothetical protein
MLPNALAPAYFLVPKCASLLGHLNLLITVEDYNYPTKKSMLMSHSGQHFNTSMTQGEVDAANRRGILYKGDSIRERDATSTPYVENDLTVTAADSSLNLSSYDRPGRQENTHESTHSSHGIRLNSRSNEVLLPPPNRLTFENDLYSSRNTTIFEDLDHLPYTEGSTKMNRTLIETAMENSVMTRQFPDKVSRDRKLGTSTALFNYDNFLRHVVSQPGMVMVDMRLRNLFGSGELFKQACLWKWSIAGQSGISLNYFSANNSITSRSDLNEAIGNFDLFQSFTFGSCWSGCTAAFIQDLALNQNLVYLKTKYVQQEFEKLCCWMFTKLREEAVVGADMRWGDHWAALFSEKLKNHEISHGGQLVWEHVETELSAQSLTPSKAASTKVSSAGADGKQVCFGFLRQALSVIGVDGNAPSGCLKTGCSRAHENVFSFTKAYVINQLNVGSGNQQDLIAAVSSSNRFA